MQLTSGPASPAHLTRAVPVRDDAPRRPGPVARVVLGPLILYFAAGTILITLTDQLRAVARWLFDDPPPPDRPPSLLLTAAFPVAFPVLLVIAAGHLLGALLGWSLRAAWRVVARAYAWGRGYAREALRSAAYLVRSSVATVRRWMSWIRS